MLMSLGLALLSLGLPLLSGCGGGHAMHPVAPGKAKETLQLVLEGWKEGKPIDSWRNVTPEIVVQDQDWSAGKKLTAFEIQGDGQAIDANLHCDVKLTVEDRGKPVTKTVGYLVGTSPVLTVFRKLGP